MRMRAHRTLAVNDNSALADRLSKREDKENEIPPLMSIEWAPGLARAVGSGPIDKLFSSGGYAIFRDMLGRAADDTIPVSASAWRI